MSRSVLKAKTAYGRFLGKCRYVPSSGTFTAAGWSLYIDFDGVAPPDKSIDSDISNFSITATLNSASPVGSLKIDGKILGLVDPSATLLTGDLLRFGYQDGGGTKLDFLFTVTGGELKDSFGGIGSPIGVTMDVGSQSYPDNWMTIGYTNDGLGVSDTFAIPEPSGFVVGLLLILACVASRFIRARSAG